MRSSHRLASASASCRSGTRRDRRSFRQMTEAVASFDAVVVGSGQAGPSLAARLSGAGGKVAVIEKHRFGGTCVNNGCTPTKAMVASAYAAHVARRAADYGVLLDAMPHIDMKRVKARKDEIVGKSSHGGETCLEGLHGTAASP